ncbi:MAG: hydrogenase iron-sulfur subunit [Thermodesulfobacteriota bacterium]
MSHKLEFTLALFYCQNTPGSGERERQALERQYGDTLRLFPLPCSGRMEPLHLMKALEEYADAAVLVACPEGACRYFEGNRRAGKRVARTRDMLRGVGLEPDRAGIVTRGPDDSSPLAALVKETLAQVEWLGISPVRDFRGKKKGKKLKGS